MARQETVDKGMPDHFQQLEQGLATLNFPVYRAVGFPSRITGWGGGPIEERRLTSVQVGDFLGVAPNGPNPPGVNVHTSLKIDNASEEEIALVVVPLLPRNPGEPPDLDISLEETWRRKAEATHTASRTHEIDGSPEPWTVVQGDDAWAATRHQGELTLTVCGRGIEFDEIRLERVADPTSLNRPKWTGKATGVAAVPPGLKPTD
jgi:hypothetical protein